MLEVALDFMGWSCFSQSPFSALSAITPPAQARTGPAAALPCCLKNFMLCSSSSQRSREAKARRPSWPDPLGAGCAAVPVCRAARPAQPGPGPGPGSAPARPLRRAGRWRMCRLGAGLAHPETREVGDGRTDGQGAAGETGAKPRRTKLPKFWVFFLQ